MKQSEARVGEGTFLLRAITSNSAKEMANLMASPLLWSVDLRLRLRLSLLPTNGVGFGGIFNPPLCNSNVETGSGAFNLLPVVISIHF